MDESEDEYFGEDDMPELFDPEIIENEFDVSSSASNKSKLYKNSLLRFPNNLNKKSLYGVIYGIMFNKINGEHTIFLEDAEKTLGTDLFIELKNIEKSTMLDHSIFGFFDRCQSINNVLQDFGYFLRFYERRNKFRYQLRQKLKEKNKMKRELSACVIQNFNGYKLIRNSLNSKERKDFVPVDIVYEPVLNENKSIECFFAPKIYLGYTTAVERTKKGKEIIERCVAGQCHYCNNFFIKSAEKMQKHLSVCSGKAGFTYSFDNGKILDYQSHYKNLADLPFSVYYDFETTTGSVIFFDANMYVVSYCIIVAFHPELSIPRIVILRSYDQNPNELISLTHFKHWNIIFLIIQKILIRQL